MADAARKHLKGGSPARAAEPFRITTTGRLEELNGHGEVTGRLWEADGTKWVCRFRPEHLEQLAMAWMRTVRLVGRAVDSGGHEKVLAVESVRVLDQEAPAVAQGSASPFWGSPSLDELARQQQVAAVDNLDEISALWPVDDDPDEFLRHVLRQRQSRRSAQGGHAA